MSNMDKRTDIANTFFSYADSQKVTLAKLAKRVGDMREESGALKGDALVRIRKFFRIKNIYHSNAIEGNALNIGETRVVVEDGLTLTGKSLKDQTEAKNLSEALDFLEEIVKQQDESILESDIRQIHQLVLKGIHDEDAGKYRLVNVEISGSEFSPPGPEKIPADMQEFGEWLKTITLDNSRIAETNAVVVAAVAHTWFVHTHPFIDGNGRVARLLLNLILMRAGFPPAIITKADRQRYYDSLEEAQSSNLAPFIALLMDCINESLEEYEDAAKEEQDFQESIKVLAEKFSPGGELGTRNEFEVWRNAMELLKSYFRQAAGALDSESLGASVNFREFDPLEYEKYVSLRFRKTAKRTWFFRIDFMSKGKKARYLFFFGYVSDELLEKCNVTLHVAREEPSESWNYERLSDIKAPNVPDIHELGYNPKAEKFVSKGKSPRSKQDKIEVLGKRFFQEVIEKHFASQ